VSTELLQPAPGINTQITQSENRNGWSLCANVRWKDGKLQKRGGWQRLTSELLVGIARGIRSWTDLSGNPFLIAGTDQRVELFDGGSLNDITPLRATDNVTVDFSTIINTPTVTIKDVTHGAVVGDWIYLSTQVSVGGLVLYGYYQVTSVVDPNDYTITATANATSTVNHGGAVPLFTTANTFPTINVTLNDHGLSIGQNFNVEISTVVGGITIVDIYAVTSITNANVFVITAGTVASSSASGSENGGDVRILYLLPSGLSTAMPTSGYGVGDYGAGDYGVGGSGGAFTALREWYWDAWGEDAIGNYTNGGAYVWIPPLSVNPRAVVIPEAPSQITTSFVSMPQQIFVTLGCDFGGTFDPCLVRWCGVADYTDWIASPTNQAGSFRIQPCSKVVGGVQTPQQALILTDLNAWSMRYIQPPFVFGFIQIGSGCGLISGRAIWPTAAGIYWMSQEGFYVADSGGVRQFPCSVWDRVFGDSNANPNARTVDRNQAGKVYAGGNSDFSEIIWAYASTQGNGEVDSYVKVALRELDANGNPLWDYGDTTETAWQDRSAFGPAVGADVSGLFFQHEVSNDADGIAMNSFAETGFFDIAQGRDIMFVDRMIPDAFQTNGKALLLTPKSAKWPNAAPKTYGPFRLTPQTEYINPRIRGRLISYRIGSTDLGSFWRMGLFRYRAAPDGRGS
jgi:hypothetical protein